MDKKRPVEGAAEGNDPPVVIDKKMEMVIDKMFDRCFSDKKYKHVIGIALESRRLDKVKQAIELSGDAIEDNLGYTFNLAQKIVKRKEFRTEVLRLLLLIYQNRNDQGNFDHYKIAKCQFYL
jgi:26S proteasome regulatory subunit N2